MRTITERLAGVSWVDTLLQRRSRRFALGMKMPSGPLAFTSRHSPRPLSEDEEAALAFAASGITGPCLADLCYASGEGGSIMNGLVGRTAGSGDGIQAVALFVINDQGCWLLKRPRELSGLALKELILKGQQGAFTDFYRQARVQVKTGRAAPPKAPLFNINANRWSAYAPGTTCLLPVNDLTFLYLNGMLEVLNEATGAFVLDERAGFRPAGLAQFARSKGGHLFDDPKDGRVATIELIERLVTEFVTVEQGMMLQNAALMTQALGLGGFPNFANHEFGWFQALGFRMGQMPASRYLGAGPIISLGMKLLHRDQPVPYPLGLEIDGQPLLKSYCPPYFPSMAEAVREVANYKNKAFQESIAGGLWKDGAEVARQVAPVTEAAIAATTAYAEYIWQRYGRFPAYLAPFRTVVCFQACHLDAEFYDKFYKPAALSATQRADFAERTA